MASIESLPVELFNIIAHHLAATELGHLRRTSFRLCAILTPFFQTRYLSRRTVAVTKDDLDGLQQLLGSHLGSNFRDLTVKGGLVDGTEIRNEYYNLQNHEWSRLEHRILRNLEDLRETHKGPTCVDLLADAMRRIPRRQIECLSIEEPTAASLTFSTTEVRRTISWKTLTIVLQSLARSQIDVGSFKATGFTCPPEVKEHLDPGVEAAFRRTTSLELDFEAFEDPNKLEWMTKLLRCFAGLKQASICISNPRRVHDDRELFASAISEGLQNRPLQNLVLGRGPASLQMMLTYLAARHLDHLVEQFKTHVYLDATKEALRFSPSMKLESIELRRSEEIVVHLRHENCCECSVGISNFQKDFGAIRKHVDESTLS